MDLKVWFQVEGDGDKEMVDGEDEAQAPGIYLSIYLFIFTYYLSIYRSIYYYFI